MSRHVSYLKHSIFIWIFTCVFGALLSGISVTIKESVSNGFALGFAALFMGFFFSLPGLVIYILSSKFLISKIKFDLLRQIVAIIIFILITITTFWVTGMAREFRGFIWIIGFYNLGTAIAVFFRRLRFNQTFSAS